MKSSKKIRKVSLLGLILVGSMAITQVLASPHHIIIDKTKYKAKEGDILYIYYKMYFDREEEATNEVYGDRCRDWDISLHSEKKTGKHGEKVKCWIEVHVPSDASDGTYGLILQDKDVNGKVTSRVSIFTILYKVTSE